MDKRIKQLWVDDLRKNVDNQGRLVLKKGDKYCCLGRLCELHSQETGNKWDADDNYLGKYGQLPSEVVDWAGVNGSIVRTKQGDLDYLNDFGRTFIEISNIIEAEL